MLSNDVDMVAQCGEKALVDDWKSLNFELLSTDDAYVRGAPEGAADGQYVSDTAPVDHIYKSGDSDIKASKRRLGLWTGYSQAFFYG